MPSLAAEKKKQRKVSGLINSTCSLFKRSLLMCPWVNDHGKEMVSRRGNGHVYFFQNPRQEQRRRKHEVHIFTGPCFPIILCTLLWALQVGPKQVLNLICGSILVFFKTQIQTNALPKHFLLHILCNISSSVTGSEMLTTAFYPSLDLFFHLNTMGFWYG